MYKCSIAVIFPSGQLGTRPNISPGITHVWIYMLVHMGLCLYKLTETLINICENHIFTSTHMKRQPRQKEKWFKSKSRHWWYGGSLGESRVRGVDKRWGWAKWSRMPDSCPHMHRKEALYIWEISYSKLAPCPTPGGEEEDDRLHGNKVLCFIQRECIKFWN